MESTNDLVSSFRDDSCLEMSVEELDNDSFSSDEDSSEIFMDKLITLKWLSLREKQLKIAIIYENLKKERKVMKDKDLLSEEIAELQEELKELNRKCTNDVLTSNKVKFQKTLTSIKNRKGVSARHWRNSEKQRKIINGLLHKEKELTKQQKNEKKEIASIKDRISKLDQGIPDSRNIKKHKVRDVESEKEDELQRLHSENKQAFDRTQFLAKVTQSLVAHHLSITPSSKTNDLLPPLQDVCERILDSQLDDPSNLTALLDDIKAVQI